MADMQAAEDSTPTSSDDRIEDFSEFLDQLEEERDDEISQNETGEAGEDDPAQAAKPDDPVITPPISWDNDAKDLFEQLPPDLQAKVAEREAQRERALQSATTQAAEAKRNAFVEANAGVAEQQRFYAAHLEQITALYAPQRPDPALLAQDPQAGRFHAG